MVATEMARCCMRLARHNGGHGQISVIFCSSC